MSKSRRDFFRNAFVSAGLLASVKAWARQAAMPENTGDDPSTGRNAIYAGQPFMPAQTLDIPDLPWTDESGVKVFHLVAEPVRRQVVPGKTTQGG